MVSSSSAPSRVHKSLTPPSISSLLQTLPTNPTPSAQLASNSCLAPHISPPAPLALASDLGRSYGTQFDADLKAYQDATTLLEQGSYYADMLYAFRSLSRAIPAISEPDPERKARMHKAVFEVIGPEMERVKEVQAWADACVSFWIAALTKMSTADSTTVRDQFLDILIHLLDCLQKVDSLKDNKACLQNDFVSYKRSFSLIRSTIPSSDIIQEDIQSLQMFLSNPFHPKLLIVNQLRDRLKQTHNHADPMIEMIKICCDRINSKLYTLPEEKYRYHRSLPYLLFLLDDENKKTFNVFRARTIPLARIQKIIKSLPVLPVIGDMTISLPSVLKLCPNYDQEKMDQLYAEGATGGEYDITKRWKNMQGAYAEYSSRFAGAAAGVAQVVAGVKRRTELKKPMKPAEVVEKTGPIYDVVMEGVGLLGEWTSAILEVSAWKYQHAASPEMMKSRGHDPSAVGDEGINPFEQVVRYNYSKQELCAFVECIAMVKSLADMIMSSEAGLAPAMRMYMHSYVQSFVGEELRPMMEKADKKGRPVSLFLRKVCDLVADYVQAGSSSKSIRKAIKEVESGAQKSHNCRVVAPGATQLHLLRTMIRSMSDFNGRGHYISDCKDKDTAALLKRFFDDTLKFPYAEALSSTVQSCCRLGDLWYRELYIEITKKIQFPIEMSLPFILTETIVHSVSGDVPLLENVAYVMDLYNDAAHWALQTLQAQHLYDEIEAEVNLVFDQAVFLIGEEMYSHYKDCASSELLPAEYKNEIERVKGYKQLTINEKRFKTPASQRHVLLLGRSIDMNYLLGNHVNHKLQKDLEAVIKRLESSDLSNVLEIEKMLQVIELTHSKLSSVLELDPFDQMLDAANADVNSTHVCGRIVAHMKTTVVEDVVPNYSFNIHTSRFVKSPITFKSGGRDGKPQKLPTGSNGFGMTCGKAWDYYFNLSRGFVGRNHVAAMVRMIGEAGVNFCMAFFLEHIEEKLNEIKPYLKNLSEGLPPIKLPKVMFGIAGCFGMFEARLKQYFQYMDFLDESFQFFREVGNVVSLVAMIDEAVTVKQVEDYVGVAGYLGVRCTLRSEFDGIAAVGRERKRSEVGENRRTTVEPVRFPDYKAFLFEEMHSTPLHKIGEDFARGASSCMSRVRAPKAVTDYVSMVERTQDAYEHLGDTAEISFGRDLLDRITAICSRVGLKEELGYDEGPESVMTNEKTDEFYRLFSVLNFLLCMEHKSRFLDDDDKDAREDATDPHIFGHGFAISGIIFLHILKQCDKFRLLDLSYHILKVKEQQDDMKWRAPEVKGLEDTEKNALKFVGEAEAQRKVHEIIFGILDKVGFTKEEREKEQEKKIQWTYSPPFDDDLALDKLTTNVKTLLHKNSSGANIDD